MCALVTGVQTCALPISSNEALPDLWKDLVQLGWFGLHLPEAHGGSGYTLEELVIVVEQLGRVVAPGPFVPTVIASALIAAAGDDDLQSARQIGRASCRESVCQNV